MRIADHCATAEAIGCHPHPGDCSACRATVLRRAWPVDPPQVVAPLLLALWAAGWSVAAVAAASS